MVELGWDENIVETDVPGTSISVRAEVLFEKVTVVVEDFFVDVTEGFVTPLVVVVSPRSPM